MNNLVKMLIDFFIGTSAETAGRGLFQFLQGLGTQKIQDHFEKIKKIEDGRSRILHVLADLGKNAKNMKKYHLWASQGKLFDTKGKKITENRFVYLLTLIDPERLEEMIRWMDQLPEEEFKQMLEILDEDSLGDFMHKMKTVGKELFNSFKKGCPRVFKNLKQYYEKIKKEAKKEEKKLTKETNEALQNIDNIENVQTLTVSKILKQSFKNNWLVIVGILIFTTISALSSIKETYKDLDKFLENTAMFSGMLVGFYLVIFIIYVFLIWLFVKTQQGAKETAKSWLKSVKMIARFINSITSIAGYPAIEIARLNVVMTEGTTKAISNLLITIKQGTEKLLIFITILFSQLFAMQYIPHSPLMLIVVMITSLILSFSVMGIAEPILKPLEGKMFRRIIRPISLVVPIVGTIVVIYIYSFYNVTLFNYAMNLFMLWMIILLSMSFASYHGMYVTNKARLMMKITFLTSVVVLFISGNILGIKNTNAYKTTTKKTKVMLANVFPEEQINGYATKQTKAYAIIDSHLVRMFDLHQYDLVSIFTGFLNKPKTTIGKDSSEYFGINYYSDTLYVNIHDIRTGELPDSLKQNGEIFGQTTDFEYIEEREFKEREFKVINIDNRQLPIGSKFIIKTQSGLPFMFNTSDQGWVRCESGTRFVISKPAMDAAKILVNDKLIITRF